MAGNEPYQLSFEVQAQKITIGDRVLTLLVPEPGAVQTWYENEKTNKNIHFPYWSKLWPAALGMCRFLAANTGLVEGKTVLEIAAGLGLPSLLAARWAKAVNCTDIAPEAVMLSQLSARMNKLPNLKTAILNWSDISLDVYPEVLIISDANYDPDHFDQLYSLLMLFMEKDTTVLLSTPQRLLAKPFIMRLLPYCTLHSTEIVDDNHGKTEISIYVLQKNGNAHYL